MSRVRILSLALAGVLVTTAAPAMAASITAKVPSCEAVGQAIKNAYGQIASIKDNTDAIHKLGGQAPYTVYRACDVYLPGNKIPLSITFDGPLNREFLENMSKFGSLHGVKSRKLDGAGYGDLAYLTPQIGGGTGINVLVGNIVMTITAWTSAQDTENMAEHIIKLM